MKKFTAIFLSVLLVLSLVACGNNNQSEMENKQTQVQIATVQTENVENNVGGIGENAGDSTNAKGTEDGSNILIAYYSKDISFSCCLLRSSHALIVA